VTFAAAALLASSVAAWVEPATGMEFVNVPAGRFVMGSPPGEKGREAQERPHEVTITRPFHLGRFEVTREQWRRVMGEDPSHFTEALDVPVERVSWIEVRKFLRRLEARSPGSRFRLPTEAEWEYACRAGSATAYNTGDTLSLAQANILPAEGAGRAAGRTTRVGSYAPNAWGLYDMHGNVWEWTADEHCPYLEGATTDPRGRCGAALKVIRGGSWYFGADSARCALRYTHRPQDRGFSLGFRVVREPPLGGAGRTTMKGWVGAVAVAVAATSAPLSLAAAAGEAEVKVTHQHLVPLCLDGAETKVGQRSWRLSAQEHVMAFTMRNQPRTGIGNAGPGVAAVKFTPQAGHKYEIEVRALADAYATRVWEREKWVPVVRDRTDDRLVSGEPEWREWAEGDCQP
jgi:formylglycine-generating enzyme required for sulfatase activity